MVFASEEPTSSRRRWVAVGVATFLELISYWSLLRAYVAGQEELGPEVVVPSFSFGMIMVPAVFVALAFLSRHRRAPLAVLMGMGLFLLVALPFGLFILAVGLVMGFGAGGIVTYRMEEVHRYGPRVIAVLAAAVYVLMLMLVSVPLGLFTGGFVPFLALVFADRYSEQKAAHEATPAPDEG